MEAHFFAIQKTSWPFFVHHLFRLRWHPSDSHYSHFLTHNNKDNNNTNNDETYNNTNDDDNNYETTLLLICLQLCFLLSHHSLFVTLCLPSISFYLALSFYHSFYFLTSVYFLFLSERLHSISNPLTSFYFPVFCLLSILTSNSMSIFLSSISLPISNSLSLVSYEVFSSFHSQIKCS